MNEMSEFKGVGLTGVGLTRVDCTSTGVYRIPCDDCSQCYIGETKRALTLRLREHQANCRNQKQHSAVVDHSA